MDNSMYNSETSSTSSSPSNSAIQAFKKYGILRSELLSALINEFHLISDHRNLLTSYYTLHISGQVLRHNLKDGMYHNHLVIYYNCTATQAAKAPKIALSYRVARPEFGIENYVLVKIVPDSTR